MFRLFETLADEDTFADVMDLLHVELRFWPLPGEDGLENVRDIVHEVHRIIPTYDQVTRLFLGLLLRLFVPVDIRNHFRHCCLSHPGKLGQKCPFAKGFDGVFFRPVCRFVLALVLVT